MMAFELENKKLKGDARLLDLWKRITDPLQALGEVNRFWDFIGSDPYYRDLNDALREMVDRVLTNPGG